MLVIVKSGWQTEAYRLPRDPGDREEDRSDSRSGSRCLGCAPRILCYPKEHTAGCALTFLSMFARSLGLTRLLPQSASSQTLSKSSSPRRTTRRSPPSGRTITIASTSRSTTRPNGASTSSGRSTRKRQRPLSRLYNGRGSF